MTARTKLTIAGSKSYYGFGDAVCNMVALYKWITIEPQAMFLWRGQLRVGARICFKVYERSAVCLSLRVSTESSLRYFSTSFSKTVCRSNLLLALSSKMSCPGNRMRWNLTPNEIPVEADNLMVKSKSVYDTIGALSPNEVNYDNTIKV